MKKCFCLVLALVLFFAVYVSRVMAMAMPHLDCSSYPLATQWGTTFVPQGVPEYINGLLTLHFSYNPTAVGENVVLYSALLTAQNCASTGSTGGNATISFPPGTSAFSLRFISDSEYKFFNDLTKQPLACAGCDVIFTPTISGPYKVQFTLASDLTSGKYNSAPIDVESSAPSITPVLIVPGILGTDIYSGENKLWANLPKMAGDIGDGFMDPLKFNDDLKPFDPTLSLGDLILSPVVTQHFYDLLIQEFQNQGYKQGTSSDATLFTFPYDWRYGVSGNITPTTTTEDLLKQKIDDILAQTGAGKVDVVAHSTGGLLVKKYVMDHPSDNHIGKAVFVGVPNLGAPQAIKVLLEGDSFGIPFLADSEMQKIAQNLPVSYDLAPSREYYNQNGSFISTVSGIGYGYNLQNLDYSQTDDFLINGHHFNQQALAGAHNLHDGGLDEFDMRTAGVDVYSIVGCKSGTLGSITQRSDYAQASSSVDAYDLSDVAGDGTVPMVSAQSLRATSTQTFFAVNADHGKMPSQDGIRQKIVNIISGSNLDTGSNIISNADLAQDPGKCQLSGHWWQIFSPVNIEVVDQTTGNSAGLAANGSVQNNIPGADYQIIGEHKFVFAPTDAGQIYSVKLTGTATGTFTFKDGIISGGQAGTTQVFSNLPVTPSLIGTVNLGASDSLSLDADGNGTVDQVVQPSSIIDASLAGDVTPPVSTSTIAGLPGAVGFYHSNATITLSAIDPVDLNPASGVLGIKYSLDGNATSSYQAPIAVATEGNHSISFFSTDRAGNNEPVKTVNFTIDKTPPEFVIQFNPQSIDLQFSGSDNISTTSAVSVLDQDDTITLTDQAGNTSQIQLAQKNRKILMAAAIKTILYNGQQANVGKNVMAFAWAMDKNKNVTTLSQSVLSKNGYSVLAVYDGKKTLLIGKDQNGPILKTLTGLILLKVSTNRGDLMWGY